MATVFANLVQWIEVVILLVGFWFRWLIAEALLVLGLFGA